jgi:hypothetical protein
VSDITPAEQSAYERSQRLWDAIRDASDNGSIFEILEAVAQWQFNLHDVEGTPDYVRFRGMKIGGKLIEFLHDLDKYQRNIGYHGEGHCSDCDRDPCDCFNRISGL